MTDQEAFEACIDRLAACLDKLESDGMDPDLVSMAVHAHAMMDIEDENLCPHCARVRIATLRGHLDRIEAGLPPNTHKH
jgi:hypothetical protein